MVTVTRKGYVMSQKEKWYRMLGHINFKQEYLNILAQNKLLKSSPDRMESDFMKYVTYIENKIIHLEFKNERIVKS